MKLVAVAALFTVACGGEPNTATATAGRAVAPGDATLDGAGADGVDAIAIDPWDPPASAVVGPSEPPGIAPPVFPILSVPAPGPLVAGGHSTSLRALAVIDDGSLAVSADHAGGVRLWPTLDGKHEPVVVAMNGPVSVAVARDGTDLAIVGLDGAGALEIVRTRPSGEALLRSLLVIERPAVGVLATSAGLVALLDDQSLALFDLRGVRTGTLVPAPGHRIAGLVTRHDRVLALDATPEVMRGRWLELGDAPRWGDETPPLKLDPATAALSPDLSRLAALSADRTAIVVVALASGKQLERIFQMEVFDDSVIGYVDAKTLAVQTSDRVVGWWRDGTLETTSTSPFGKIAVADRRVVAANGGVLELCEYDRESKFLGYSVAAASHVRALAGGFLVARDANLVAVDGQLRAKRALAIPAIESLSNGVDEVIPVDARHAFVVGRSRTGWELHLVDLDRETHELVLLTQWGSVAYEPATRMYAVSSAPSMYFGYYDPKTGTATDPVRYDVASYHTAAVRLLDPATSNGVVAVVLESSNIDEVAEVVEIKSVKLGRDTPVELGRRRTVKLVDDDFAMGDLDPGSVLARVIATRPAFQRRRSSPDGTLVAIVDDHRITLVERAGGRERWAIPNPGLDDVAWLATGELVATGGAIVQLDRATGALGDRQCGWGFGLWDDESGTTISSPACDASAE